jgi:hypothetical protein
MGKYSVDWLGGLSLKSYIGIQSNLNRGFVFDGGKIIHRNFKVEDGNQNVATIDKLVGLF